MVSISELMAVLPELLFTVQIIMYVFLILFFGSISILGLRTYFNWIFRLLIRIGIGFLALITGIAMSSMLPFFKDGIWALMQADLIVGGLITSIILGIALFLITFDYVNIPKLEKTIENLRSRLHEAKSKRPAQKSKYVRVGGLIFMALFLVISLLNFQGFPDINDRISDTFGFAIGNLESECRVISALVLENQEEISQNLVLYENAVLERSIENRAGSPVLQMFSTDIEGRTIILAITEDEQNCVATETEVCVCGRV